MVRRETGPEDEFWPVGGDPHKKRIVHAQVVRDEQGLFALPWHVFAADNSCPIQDLKVQKSNQTSCHHQEIRQPQLEAVADGASYFFHQPLLSLGFGFSVRCFRYSNFWLSFVNLYADPTRNLEKLCDFDILGRSSFDGLNILELWFVCRSYAR